MQRYSEQAHSKGISHGYFIRQKILQTLKKLRPKTE